ncbi:hypothetical protein D5085_06430 [Ectothiorhodospiraceae bacterium BW-2]|nr:hypothetical protein D5085_06430 [Ectothiorhodospiraceae bacterium BW-2]
MYMGVVESVFLSACGELPDEIIKTYEFVDIGSGKGRGLILAHECGFSTITGYEHSVYLNRIARDNLRRLNIEGVTIHECDIRMASYTANNKVIFAYNPFNEALFRCFLLGLATHIINNAIGAYFIYVNPLHEDMLASFGFSKIVEHRSDSNCSYVIYGINIS